MAFPLTMEQRAVVENRGGALLVSAAAGSGKAKYLHRNDLIITAGRDLYIGKMYG